MMGTLSELSAWLFIAGSQGLGFAFFGFREDLTDLLNKRKLTLADYVNRKHLLRPMRSAPPSYETLYQSILISRVWLTATHSTRSSLVFAFGDLTVRSS